MIRRIKRRYRLRQIDRKMDKIEERYIATGLLRPQTEEEFVRLLAEKADLFEQKLGLIEERHGIC